MKDRFYSFLIPWFTDAAFALAGTAAPLLALRFGANAIMLGAIGFAAQLVRIPVCFASGRASERLGRKQIAIPAICVTAAGAIGLASSWSIASVAAFFSLIATSAGMFFPPFQAHIGDVSKPGHLRKNLGAYNLGWCSGGAIAALGAGWLVTIGLPVLPYVAAGASLTAGALLLAWRARPVRHSEDPARPLPVYPNSLLIVSRLGHFTAFFAISIIRVIFPKLGCDLGWSDATIAKVVAMSLVGQATGMMVAGASSWWRGKLWPQLTAQALMVASGLGTAAVFPPAMFGACFFVVGFALSIAYSGALYYGLSSRAARGRNTGIHESLVAIASTLGSLLGGVASQFISPRAPYVLLAVMAASCLVLSGTVFRRTSRGTPDAQPSG
ncbi:MAG: hypothetical protein A2Z18_08065 [Armatimonadetes bacterium RBG_16_58_9]|nr:MAG: hypothetical protein A2Z18_08065 [Armatimonadetes bacterium RBG_16_58_9]